MKKAIIAIAALAATMAAFTARADTWADPATGITWTYTVSNGKASVGGGSSSSPAIPITTTGAITIPTTLGGKPVTSLSDYAFNNCNGLTSVTIPESVTSIGQFAFYNCTSLRDVMIPHGMTYISYGLFCGCSNLKNVTIPDNVRNINNITTIP